MRKGVVTIVLPIYNVEKYLERCIKSVVNQSYSNLEIILVDDESPDNCPAICDEWAKKDQRIKVIHKKNGGLGYARNTGIENATGEYICFFDSDDYVALDTVERAYNLAVKENADIVSFGYNQVDKDGRTKNTFIPKPGKLVYEGEEIQDIFLPNMIAPDTSTGEVTNLWMSMCGAMFSMDLIKRSGWRLVSERDIISEDVYSLLCLYKDVKKVAVICEAFYFYCENTASLTHTYKTDRYERIKIFYDACIKKCNELKYPEIVKKRFFYPYLSNVIAAMKMIIVSDMSNSEKKGMINTIIADSHIQEVISKANISHESINRKLLIYMIKKRNWLFCYLMIKAKV